MKTAITAMDSSPDTLLGKQFGKCMFFYILSGKTLSEIIENPARTRKSCKADTIVGMLRTKGVERVISGDFGTHVQQALNKSGIQMIIYPGENVKVKEIIKKMNFKSTNQ